MELIEGVILGAFCGLQIAFHKMEGYGEHPVVQNMRKRKATAWLVHPTLWEAIKDYSIHLVIYSGYVISKH